MLSHMGAVIRVALSAVPANGQERVKGGTARHRAVLDAIDRRDPAAAEKGMRALLDRQRPLTTKEEL